MKEIVTIKGKPVIEIYESFEGSYWFITEKCHKQDSVIRGKVYKDDQILFGYARLSICPEWAEFGYISETELKLLGWKVWKVEKKNWQFCPEVEVIRVSDDGKTAGEGKKALAQPSALSFSTTSHGGG
jgi:hypothetical protein